MEWLNYHHLFYFWTVAKEGSIAKASALLRLAPPTISSQVRALEHCLGEELFDRGGRALALTEVGQVVFRYADQIFGLGRELLSVVQRRPTGQPLRLNVGLADAVPKLVAKAILGPVFALAEPVHLVCLEDSVEHLVTALAAYQFDIVLSDRPVPATDQVKAVTHELGECNVAFVAAPSLAERLRPGFPQSLDGAPALLPTENTEMRQSLDRWFEAIRVRPTIVAEFEDSALLQVFAADELGFFAVPSVIAADVGRLFGVAPVGETAVCRDRYYAITLQRKLENPAVATIIRTAQATLFSRSGGEGSS